ncbi:hypothetical protein L198_02274 [Cryptococcus wingfieldii CBS 7118]|uniref:Glycosyl transferase CAP10 domain-containing protein n=1 Tax=Cryptococcus wingfieldii CBS 7118 TaxID=1295528 RepID=A0A1E3JTH7_9TREE|nr:hypothetical protein L198_02274 [Cryptococcus wingfieldii CBS 7118]ODO03427.1 hypothetical protein L198_02274 [Cryptococcus wingfieldii CBS 7118]
MVRHSRAYALFLVLAILFAIHYYLQPFALPKPDLEQRSPRYTELKPTRSKPFRTSPQKHTGLERVPEGEATYDNKGLFHWSAGKKHPIALLIEQAEQKAKAMEAKIANVKSVKDAARDYTEAFGMRPPKGYAYTQSVPLPHIPALPSLIPFVHKPFDAFLSHPAFLLRDRVTNLRNKDKSIFTLTFVPDGEGDEGTACESDEEWDPEDWDVRSRGRVVVRGEMAWSWRCNNTLSYILPILPLLPPDILTLNPPLEIAFSTDDGPRGMVHNSFREKSEALARAGRVWPDGQLHQAEQSMRWTYGWSWSCPEDTPLKTMGSDMVLNDIEELEAAQHGKIHFAFIKISRQRTGGKAFVADPMSYMDYCQNPHLMAVELQPAIATCRTMWNSDILGVPLDGVRETVPYISWDDKPNHKVFWRGTATGSFHSKRDPWRSSQRERLHFFSTNTSGSVDLLLPNLASRSVPRQDVLDAWFDVGLSGGPVQCSEEDGSCADMAREIEFKGRVKKEDGAKYRYVVDVDGNGWSSRFRRLLQGNNVVFKSTLCPEWFDTLLIPWYHYVPVKMDYSDFFDIISYFEGSPSGDIYGNDDQAKVIAQHALDFVNEKWREEDMRSFGFLLVLEWWRMLSDNREEASFQG